MLMPGLDQFRLMLADNSFNFIQVVRFEPVIEGQLHWVKPEFGLVTIGFDVHVRRLLVFVAEEGKPITPDSQYRWHRVDRAFTPGILQQGIVIRHCPPIEIGG
jgi:hypothetical protein